MISRKKKMNFLGNTIISIKGIIYSTEAGKQLFNTECI